MLKTPELLTAAQRAAHLNLGSPGSQPNKGDAVTQHNQNTQSGKKPSYQDIARKSLLGTPAPSNAMGSMSPFDVVDGSVSNLAITDIERYEFDPRTEPNPLYDAIKESIRANGILNHISVTKRPGHARYTVYGGGNTRLRIAKELYEEGDERFARLTVIVKVWKGNASTIAAHLAENEQRGGISFWDKAQGVLSFKNHYEAESGEALSAADLNRQLKQSSGLNFGLRMLQNFLFAVEHLAPIGPWLRSREVNSVIRPQLAGILDVSLKLGDAPAIEKAMQDVLHRHAALLSTQRAPMPTDDASEDAEPATAGLDAEALVADVMTVVASALGYERTKLQAMVRAVEANPRIAKDTLELVDALADSPAERTKPGSSPTGIQPTVLPSAQAPLGRMLSPVAPPAGHAGRTPASGFPAQAHAGALPPLPANPSTSVSTPTSTSTPTSMGAGEDQAGQPGQPFDFASQLQPLFHTLGEIQQLVDLSDVLFTSEQMNLAFGMYLDFPKSGIDQVDGAPVAAEVVPFRRALWKLLVSLTGQLDRRCTHPMSAEVEGETILWRQLFGQGEAAFHAAAHELLGEPYEAMSLESLSQIFSHPELGFLVTRMLSQMEQLRVNHPERQLEGFEPLFAFEENP